ncbi:MAG: hypothetical protein CMP50_05870 [Flavobacteriales bacterium]|nr:hypothetical protein [Flavobacteriales bacterium]|tara:strand:- start:851 stop:1366 length:516 start_codon:yes stop_codon:yes gene_type:complete
MEIFIDNILYIAVFVTIVTLVFVFLRKNNNNNVEFNHKQLSQHEIEIKLRAYERLILFLERIEPVGMINRLQLHNQSIDIVSSSLISNIVREYEYNTSQQIYVSESLWNAIQLIKNKIINSISNASKQVSKKGDVDDLVKKILDNSKSNNLMIQQIKKMLKEEVKYVSKIR